MQKYYWAVLWEIKIYYGIDPNKLHELLKVWYKIWSTTLLDYNQRTEYIENILYFVMCVFDMYFDAEWYRSDWISFVWMFWSERPDRIKDYKKPDNIKLLF